MFMNRVFFVLLLISLGTVGCIKRQAEPPSAPIVVGPLYVQHKVTRSGETLSSIAAAYTGKSQNWTKIRDANPQLKPNRLTLGAVVNIPAELVTKKNVVAKPIDRPVDKTDRVVAKKAESVAPKRTAKPVVAPVVAEKKASPLPADTIQIKKPAPVQAKESPLVPEKVPDKVVAVEQPAIEKESAVTPGVGVVQEDATPPSVASPASTTTSSPQVVDRIDPAPDKERERLLDELLSK